MGVSGWLRKYLDDPSVLEYNETPFLDSYYMTQAYRCPDPLDENKQKRKLAMHHCSEYLRQEIDVIKPKVILAFGGEALEGVKRILSPHTKINGLKMLFSEKIIFEWNGTKVFPLVHPNGYWRSPSMSKSGYLDTLRWYISQIENQ